MDEGRAEGLSSPAMARAIAFQHAYEDAMATRVEELPDLGRAFFRPALPLVWDLNFVRVERLDGSLTAEAVAAAAERAQRGYGHRKVNVDDEAEGGRLSGGFEALGWQPDRSLVMVHRGPVPAGATRTEAVELDWHDFGTGVEDFSKELGRPAEVGRQLALRHRVTAGVTSVRWFGLRAGRHVAAFCELYSDGRTAQIETVVTLRPHRQRGLATTVVSAALDAARGHEFVFLVADADDWPRHWYTRLGFEPEGLLYRFIRAPRT
jgi:GNAT superfamily N-acetyltransferase